MDTQGIIIVLGTIFCFGMVAWVITLLVDFFSPKSTQFTMRNPPAPPPRRTKKDYSEMTYSELNEEYQRLRESIAEISNLLKDIDKSVGNSRYNNKY